MTGDDDLVIVGLDPECPWRRPPDPRREKLEICPNAKWGDFDIDVLLTWTSLGPPTDEGQKTGARSSLQTGRVALVSRTRRDWADGSLRRKALQESHGLRVIAFDLDELHRDPFGLAHRALVDVRDRATDAEPEDRL